MFDGHDFEDFVGFIDLLALLQTRGFDWGGKHMMAL